MRRMGGLREEDPAHLPDDAHRLDRDRRDPAAGRLLLKDEILGEAYKNGFQWVWADRDRRRDDDRVLHVPADRADVLGREPGRPGGRAAHPRVAVGDDDAALDPGRSRRSSSGSSCRCPGRRSDRSSGSHGPGLLAGWLEPVFAQGSELLGRTESEFQHLRHRRRAARRRASRSRSSASSSRGACSGSTSAVIRRRPNPERVRTLTARVPFLYRASLNKWWFDDLNHLLFMVIGGRIAAFLWWFDRRVVDDTVNDIATTTVGAGTRPPPGPDRAGPELRPRDRGRPDRHGRLVPRPGGPLMTVDDIPILTIVTFTPLVGAILVAAAPSRYARSLALAASLVAWVVSLLLRDRLRPGRPGRPGRSSSSEELRLDPAVRDPVQGRRRRPVADPRRPDDDPDRGSASSPRSPRSRTGSRSTWSRS